MFESLSYFHFAFIVFAISAAYIVRGITGFGSGLIAIPLLSFIFPVTIVVPFIGLLDFIAALVHGFKFKKDIVWRDLLPLLPFSLIGVLSALYLIHNIDADNLKKALAVFLLCYGGFSLLSTPSNKIASRYWAIPAGLLGAFINALFGTGGPFYVMYLQVRQLSKHAFRATIATVFLIDGIGRVVGYFVTNVYHENTYIWVLISLPIMVIAMVVGGKIHTNLSQDDFRKGISILLILCGIALLY